MRSVRFLILGAALLALTPAVVSAQDRRIHFNIGGGPTFLGGDFGNAFSTGWGPAFGLTFDLNERFGFQFEYAFRRFTVEDYIDAQAGRLSANHSTHQLDFNIVANLTRPGGPVRVYAVFGPGAYERSIEITEYVGSGVICDPWFYVCGTYPIDAVIGSRGGWDFGFNVGGGVGFGLGDEDAEFFIESRYHFVSGPTTDEMFNTPFGETGTGKNTDGHYYPLTFGFRF